MSMKRPVVESRTGYRQVDPVHRIKKKKKEEEEEK